MVEIVHCITQTKKYPLNYSWTQEYVKNHVMLFKYRDRPHISKVYYNDDGSGFFFINETPINFTKKQSLDIIFIGVLASRIEKKILVDNFFN